jgi:hypothetical protein
VDIYRDGQVRRVGTFFTLKDAQEAYDQALRRENPDLHTAPEKVERSSNLVSTQQTGSNAD